MASDPHIARHLNVHGRVQGVFFRQWTVDTARRLGVDGWVRNRRNGTVEAVVAGAPDIVERLIAACRDGPPAASVQRIDVDAWDEVVAAGFRTLPTL